MRIRFHELAKRDLDDAIEWYDLHLPGLGDRFKKALRMTVDKIGGHPFWFPHEEDGNINKWHLVFISVLT